jgi:hypothetical protein
MAVSGALMLLDRHQCPFLESPVEVAMLAYQPEVVPVLLGKCRKIETACLGNKSSISGLLAKDVIGCDRLCFAA